MGMNIKSDRGRGGVIENIRLDNWTMDDVGRAINVSQYYVLGRQGERPDTRVSERTPVFRNISIRQHEHHPAVGPPWATSRRRP